MRCRLVQLFTKWGINWSTYLQVRYRLVQSFTKWGIAWSSSSYLQSEIQTGPFIYKVRYRLVQLSALAIPVGCSFDHKQQSANCKFTFSTLDNTESLFTGVDQLLLQANHVDLMILSTKRTIQVSDKHIWVSHMHNCLLISGRQHGSDDLDHEQNKPSVWQTHFSQSYAQLLIHFWPTTNAP